MQPVQIKKTREGALAITWSDGHRIEFPMKFLRDGCPCAHCKGETLLLGKSYRPLQLPIFTPGMFDLKKVEQVGNYAIQLAWGDGHDTGIYSWDYLRQLERDLAA